MASATTLRVAASCIAAAIAASLGAGAAAEPASRSAGAALLTYVDASGGLCGMRADGSHRLRLLRSRETIDAPTWSADGRYVAFGRVTGPDQSKIFVADAHGRVRWHFGEAHQDAFPLWSPDGRRIVYTFKWAHTIGLAVARPDGSDPHEIAVSPLAVPYAPGNPTWSPAGRLAFDDGGGSLVPQGIYSVSRDGGDRRMLVANAIEPAFSPDGSKLAYVAYDSRGSAGITVADAQGDNPRLLNGSAGAYTPVWSPDGARIAFVQDHALVVTNAESGSQHVLASPVALPVLSAPVWSPDGKLIAFTIGPLSAPGNQPFTSRIIVARADGGGERSVVRRFSKTYVQSPTWRPRASLRGKAVAC